MTEGLVAAGAVVTVAQTGQKLDQAGRALLAVAAAHQATQAALRAVTIRAIVDAWMQIVFRDLSGSWVGGIGDRIFGYLTSAQQVVASEASSYVQRALAVQGIDIERPSLNPMTFSGLASNGLDLEGLLVGAVVRAKEKIAVGGSEAEAMAAGASYLTTVVGTQISDAGRAADQVALVVADRQPGERGPASGKIVDKNGKHVRYGWVRMLTPPSCARCVLLAGKFYKWNDGFFRHLMCDCRHIPVEESVSDDLTVNPYTYFFSLSKEDQDKYFGKSNAEALRNGADMSQVINATGYDKSSGKSSVYTADDGRRYTSFGTTRRGFYGSTRAGKARVRRPTPQQIYKDANGSQAAAVTALKRFGYIV